MSRLEEMQHKYESIPIPEELQIRVQQEIMKSRKKVEGKMSHTSVQIDGASKKKYHSKKIIHGMTVTAAVVCVTFTTALNTSYVFATGAAQFPVIRELAQILTFRNYETNKDDIAVSVKIPTIEMIAENTGISVAEINQEILDCCNQYAEEAMVRAEEYRTAFLETGGTLEEWAAHEIQIVVDYEIKQQSNDYLSFIVRGTESWVGAYSESRYYNLDLNTGNRVTLEDMLGSNYMEIANASIKEQISKREEAGEVFFSAEEGGFTGISENAKFYINDQNHPVIVFEKYEIAPGSSGEIEFEIGEENISEETEIPEKYEDNFAVDSKAAKAFAQKVKDAVKNKDLEAFASLTAFPVYVGLPDVDIVETKEDFLKLDSEMIFTERLVESVANADIENLEASMAGFIIWDGEKPNINFGVVDGVLVIKGINY